MMNRSTKDNEFGSLWSFFIDNYRLTYLLVIAIVIFGLISIIQIPKESAPEVDIPVVVIITGLPGAGAETVEEIITRPLENEISGLSEITDITSTSQQGVSTVVVQFESSADPSAKMAELRDRVGRAQPNFPREAGTPSLQRISFSDVPFMNIVLSGPYSGSELRTYAEILQDQLESISDVSRVNLVGAPEPQIKVQVRSESLTRYNLSIDQIVNILAQADLDAPIGSIETAGRVYALRLDARVNSVVEIENLPVANRGEAVITVSDVADVKSSFAPLATWSRFSLNGGQPRASVSLRMFKESGRGDILTIADIVEKRIEQTLDGSLPNDIEVTVLQNDADMIRSDLNTLIRSGLFTIVIILLVLTLFLGWREALLASLVVPVSFLITFIVIGEVGLTINFLTLFSLILSLGILVDASIVVTESIFRRRSSGLSARQAVIITIKDFQAPLSAGALTTVFVFAPMLLVSGIMGEFIKSIPITVSTVLLSALFVSLGIVTTIAARLFKHQPAGRDESFWGLSGKLDLTSQKYRSLLLTVLKTKRRAYSLFATLGLALILALSLVGTGVVEVNMFPSPDADFMFIDVEAQPGTPMSETLSLIAPIENALTEDPRVVSFLTTVGQSSQAGSIDIQQGSNSHLAGLTVNLTEARRDHSEEIVAEYQERFRDQGGTRVRVFQMEEGPQVGQSIQVNLQGPELNDLEEGAEIVAQELEQIEGAEDVRNGINLTGGEFVLRVDRIMAERYGVGVAGIANTLRSSITGRTATEVRINNEDIEVLVLSDLDRDTGQVGPAVPIDIDRLRSLPIQTPSGPVTLNTFLDVSLEPGRSAINRRDGERIISVTASTQPGFNPSTLTQELQERLPNLELSDNIAVSFGGEAEEVEESFMELGRAMLIGILLFFALLVWHFSSFRQPVFILVTIPLALIGVLVGLALVGQPLSFPGAIGIVALSGIVVNNAIIIIDTINTRYYSSNQELSEAILNGAQSRFRPVILTTLTTIAGLLPLIFVSSTWAPVAYSIVFGLLFSTILTLFVVPVLYSLFARSRSD